MIRRPKGNVCGWRRKKRPHSETMVRLLQPVEGGRQGRRRWPFSGWDILKGAGMAVVVTSWWRQGFLFPKAPGCVRGPPSRRPEPGRGQDGNRSCPS